MMKKCSDCGDPKPRSGFGNQVASKDGSRSQCKVCCEVVRRASRAANPEKRSASDDKYYATNRDKKRARDRKWTADNPEAKRLSKHSRVARMKECDARLVTVKELRRLKAEPCYLCDIAPSTDIEHIIPVSKGGRWAIGNLLGACGPCNSAKNGMLLVEYRRCQRRRVAA